MKKNFFALITFALVLVNLVLTAVMALAVIPETQKANELITKVADAIDLDLQSGDAAATGMYDISQLEPFDFSETFTVNLKKGADGQAHYAIVGVSLSLNKESKTYQDGTDGAALRANESILKGVVQDTITQYTAEEMQEDAQSVRNAILQKFVDMYHAPDFIVDVIFTSMTIQ